MNTPYYKILIDDEDISDLVSGLTYEDCLNEDDLVKFSIKGVGIEYIDSEILKVGKEIQFQFGYYGGQNSELRLARISDIDYNYGKQVEVSVTAIDLGQLMKKNQSSKIWQGKKSSEIVSEIAKAYNLNVSNVEATERVFDSIPQANRTDFEFCKYLASIEQNGSFRFFIKDGSLYFGKIDLGQETAFVYTYGINIISFKPTLKDSQTSTASSETEISTYDPVAKETITETADPLTVLEEKLLGKKEVGTSSERKTESPTNVLYYDANGDEK